MALNDAALVLAANAIDAAITHMSLHSAAPDGSGSNQVGSRVAVDGTVNGSGDIAWTGVAFTGLSANQAVTHIGYWSASTGGTFYGASALTGDSTANAAGEYTVTSATETSTAS